MVDESETLGSYLKNQRESKKISLREVAKNTRVREHILKAIEEDRYELLPPYTYVKGFLSAYAKYLKLDESEVLLRYERVLKGEPVAPPLAELPKPAPPPPKPPKPAPPSPKPKEEISATKPSKPRKKIEWNTKQTWVIAGVIAASLVLFYFFSPYSPRPPESVPERPAPEKAAIEEEPAAPTPPIAAVTSVPKEKPVIEGKESVAPSSPVTSTTSIPEKKPLSLQLKAVEETWVRLDVDDQSGKGMILKPGEGISVQASNRIRMILGNAGGLDLTLNGKKLEKFGKSGEVLTLIFTSKGVEINRPEKPDPSKE
ncbi:MAG: helix-turn-helix domain-containing protein [Thermodesulfobacteriota bacterium]